MRKVNAASGVITTIAGTNADDDYIDGKSNFSYGNGQNGDAYSGGGIATGAGIYAPYGVAVDASGNLLIAEYFDHLIRKVNANDATLFFTPELWTNQVSSAENQAIENDGNEALTFSAVAPDGVDRLEVTARLEALLNEWRGGGNVRDDIADQELETATDDEMFDLLDKEL